MQMLYVFNPAVIVPFLCGVFLPAIVAYFWLRKNRATVDIYLFLLDWDKRIDELSLKLEETHPGLVIPGPLPDARWFTQDYVDSVTNALDSDISAFRIRLRHMIHLLELLAHLHSQNSRAKRLIADLFGHRLAHWEGTLKPYIGVSRCVASDTLRRMLLECKNKTYLGKQRAASIGRVAEKRIKRQRFEWLSE